MQLEMGMSTSRYFPASGTAGLARSLVSGNSLVPCPPPIITESTLLVFNDCRPVCDILEPFLLPDLWRIIGSARAGLQVTLVGLTCAQSRPRQTPNLDFCRGRN